MNEITKLDKISSIKYFLLLLTFIFMLDIFYLKFYNTTIYKINITIIEESSMELLILLVFFSFYVSIFSKFITIFVTILFDILFFLFRKKSIPNSYQVTYNDFLKKAIIENNSVMFKYIQNKKNMKDIFFDNTSLYLGSIVLILIDYFFFKKSLIIYILKFIHDNFIDNFMIVILPISLLFVIFILPFLLAYEYYIEIGKISIGDDFKKTFFEEKKEIKNSNNGNSNLTTSFNKDIPF